MCKMEILPVVQYLWGVIPNTWGSEPAPCDFCSGFELVILLIV